MRTNCVDADIVCAGTAGLLRIRVGSVRPAGRSRWTPSVRSFTNFSPHPPRRGRKRRPYQRPSSPLCCSYCSRLLRRCVTTMNEIKAAMRWMGGNIACCKLLQDAVAGQAGMVLSRISHLVPGQCFSHRCRQSTSTYRYIMDISLWSTRSADPIYVHVVCVSTKLWQHLHGPAAA